MQIRGSRSHLSKLVESDVMLIRQLLAERTRLESELQNLTYDAIAEKFEVSRKAIWNIHSKRTWGHIV